MIKQLKLQEQDVWEAWIEFDHYHPEQFGMLYLSGEYATAPGVQHPQTKIIETEYGRQLFIQLPARPTGRCRMKELFYSEPIKHPGQYDTICVYAGSELLARFSQIETLV